MALPSDRPPFGSPAELALEPARRALERAKELDHLHRTRPGGWPSGLAQAASLRFLRAVARQLLRPGRAGVVNRVPRPGREEMAVTLVGHATVLLTTAGTRVLTDPLLTDFLWGVRRARPAALHADDAAEVSLILLSHAHHDHLHLPSLRRLPPSATVVVPPRCAGLVESLGFARVVVLEPGEEITHHDLVVTAVAARHDGARGVLDRGWRGTNGYVVRGSGVSVYFAGDTGYFSGFEDVGRRMHPRVALLPIAGYEPLVLRDTHLSPLDALYAFEDLGAELLIPIGHGTFPVGYEPLDEPLRWLEELCAARGWQDRLAALSPGETCLVRGPGAKAAATPVDEPPGVG